jgi:hypothetical protein
MAVMKPTPRTTGKEITSRSKIQATLLATIFILPVGGWWLSLKVAAGFRKGEG